MISNTNIILSAVLAGLATVGIYIPVTGIKDTYKKFKDELYNIEEGALEKIDTRLVYVAKVTAPENIIGMPKEDRLLIRRKVEEIKQSIDKLNELREENVIFVKLLMPSTLRKISENRQDALFNCIDRTNELVVLTNNLLGIEPKETN